MPPIRFNDYIIFSHTLSTKRLFTPKIPALPAFSPVKRVFFLFFYRRNSAVSFPSPKIG